jgi:hypothetical protein
MGTSGLYYTSRMIHIVYLENHDLKWSNTGVYVPPIITNLIILGGPIAKPGSVGASMVCSLPVTSSYSWTGPDDASWNTFIIPSTYVLFNYGTTTYADTGWYKNNDGYPVYWNSASGQFTLRGNICSGGGTTNNLITSPLIEELNGPSNFVGDLYLEYNAPLFINATTLKWSDDQTEYPVGSNAPYGWYREGTSGVRRYWDGSTFVGFSFTRDYVCRVTVDYAGEYNPGYNNATIQTPSQEDPYVPSICDVSQANHLTYVAGNTILTVPDGITLTQHVKNYGSSLYVAVNWDEGGYSPITGELISTPPLINIKDQNKPLALVKYNKVYMTTFGYEGDGSDYGFLSVSGTSPTGQIMSISSC